MLKHGMTSRAKQVADPKSVFVPPLEVSSPDQHERTHDPVHDFRETDESSQFPLTVLATDAPANGATLDDVLLPMTGDLFPFPSPGLDLAQDWGWLHQNTLPILPVNSDSIGQIDPNNRINNGVSDFVSTTQVSQI